MNERRTSRPFTAGLAGLLLALPLLAWAADDTPTHVEVEPLRFEIGPHGRIKTIAMAADGNLLVGVSWVPETARPDDAGGSTPPGARGYGAGSERIRRDPYAEAHVYALKVVSPGGKVLATWPMTDGLIPRMIHGCDDGTVYVGGGGKLAMFDAKGRRLKQIDTDAIYGAKALTSGLYADDQHVFIAFGLGNSLRATEDFYRLNRDLTAPKLIVKRQYGCCAHIDIEARNGELLISENSRHRVNRFTLDGEFLGTWGRRNRTSIEGFAACCNPCNTDFGPNGVLYTAESGVGRVKKYTPDGRYLGLVGYVDTARYDRGSYFASQSCYIPIEVNADASRIYIMDMRASIIRVLERKKSARG